MNLELNDDSTNVGLQRYKNVHGVIDITLITIIITSYNDTRIGKETLSGRTNAVAYMFRNISKC